jgi:hypothetical protein
MLSGSRTRARSFMRPPHAGHRSTVNPNVRRKSSAHLMYRHRLPVGGGFAALVNAAGAGAALADGSAARGKTNCVALTTASTLTDGIHFNELGPVR